MRKLVRDFDLRHLNYMKSLINKFFNGKVVLHDLINGLDSCHRALKDVDSDWKREFASCFVSIDAEYGSRLEKQYSENELNDYRGLENLLKRMEHLIEQVAYEDLNFKDDTVEESLILIDKDWVMCPKCDDAWEFKGETIMVRCPGCNAKLHNPNIK